MKKLGLIGGLGPESTVSYYRGVVNGVQKAAGRLPELTVESLDVFTMLRLCGEERYDALTDYLDGAIQRLAAAGVDFAAISANTPHIIFDRLQARSPVPLLSIVEAVCGAAEEAGFRRLALVGTRFATGEGFFKDSFRKRGLEFIVPRPEEQELIDQCIASEMALDTKRDISLNWFRALLQRMAEEDGAQAVILGSAEIPLLLNEETCPIPRLDAVKIHIDAIVLAILNESV